MVYRQIFQRFKGLVSVFNVLDKQIQEIEIIIIYFKYFS